MARIRTARTVRSSRSQEEKIDVYDAREVTGLCYLTLSSRSYVGGNGEIERIYQAGLSIAHSEMAEGNWCQASRSRGEVKGKGWPVTQRQLCHEVSNTRYITLCCNIGG
jgi:hypothetical protein